MPVWECGCGSRCISRRQWKSPVCPECGRGDLVKLCRVDEMRGRPKDFNIGANV